MVLLYKLFFFFFFYKVKRFSGRLGNGENET